MFSDLALAADLADLVLAADLGLALAALLSDLRWRFPLPFGVQKLLVV